MRKFSQAVVNHPRLIFIIYAIVLVFSILAYPNIEVDYDINDYLPQSCPSTEALNIMEEEFGDGITNARVMVSDVSIAEALSYKADIEAVDGVTAVTWPDEVP